VLAEKVATRLDCRLGNLELGTFSDGEILVEVNDSVRGQHCFIIQSTCAPTNDNLMQLLCTVDALRRSSAKRITAVIPYFGYARQDRRPSFHRMPISAKLVAKIIETSGVDDLVTIDIHATQILGFFEIPTINITAGPFLFVPDLYRQCLGDNLTIVSPDVGGAVRARAAAGVLDAPVAIIDKRRAKANESEVMALIGDVEDRDCVMIDDMCDTAGTLVHAANALKENGARSVRAYCTHPVFSGPATERIANSFIDEFVVTDTIPLSPEMEATGKVRVLSIETLVAETIRRLHHDDSISDIWSREG
jgi:ribose-phosphate pyrophosphokinase